MREAIRVAGRWRGEATQLRKDGARIPVEIATIVLKGADGVESGYVSVVRDLSHKEAGRAAAPATGGTAAPVPKDGGGGLLAGGIAHDFNNILTVISGNAELLLPELAEGPDVRQMVDDILALSKRAAGLTWRQLLAFSRKQVLHPRLADLNAIVVDTEKMLRRLLGEDIQLATSLAADLAPIKVDEGHLAQVIVNLAVNVRHAMPTGGQLTLQTANVDLDMDYARVHSGVAAGRHVMLAISDGRRDDGRSRRAHFRAFLYHKADGTRHRPWACRSTRHHHAERRAHRGVQRAGAGRHLQNLFSRGRGRGCPYGARVATQRHPWHGDHSCRRR